MSGNLFGKIILAVAMAFAITACGGGGGGGSTSTSTTGGGGTTTTASLLYIFVSAANTTLPAGYKEQLIATGYYSDGTSQNFTGSATWTSSNTTVASVSSGGVATAVAVGSATITATAAGTTSFSYTLTVNAATLQSITLAPLSPTVAVGQTRQLTATGAFSDGSTADITASLWWATSNPNIATVNSNQTTSPGLTTARSPGVATISVMDPNTGLLASDTETISGYAVSGMLWYVPGNASISLTDNGADALTVTNTGASPSTALPFTFNAGVASGTTYSVVVSALPTGATHTCNVVNGAGVIGTSPAANVEVVCGTATGTLAGTPTVAGSANGNGAAASFNKPAGAVYDAKTGNIYIADTANQLIRMVTPAGVVSTVAGTAGMAGYVNGTSTSASFFNPSGVAVDSSGNIYVADSGNNVIRKITMPGATVTTLAGSPTGAAGATNSTTSTSVTFNNPAGVAVDGSNNVYVADSGNNLIRKVTSTGATTTFAGVSSTSCGGFVNGTASTSTFCLPQGVATDPTAAHVYVADTGYQQIRMISGGNVSTVAGSSSLFAGWADGVGTAAMFSSPVGISLDANGNLYIGDSGNSLVRKITAPSTASATVTTYAGLTNYMGNSDGTAGYTDGPAWINGSGYSSAFSGDEGVTVDASGNVYVADTSNHLIRVIKP